ncbi:hypothetical protein GE061_015894 [Apolygus lucorum]|uniref:Uncharacterized protein n=1 Tax=Apolygus lucorum TaxID=248454 RepID=A0A6A4JFH9_APOLU|nr:hypothetical protein GE061_015894 [Apolygus lucorum]
MNHQQRFTDLRFQLRSLQEELRTYEGIGENLENLKRRLDEAVDEIKYLRNRKETILLEETMKEIFLERAANFNQLADEKTLLELQLPDNEPSCDELRKLRKDNDLLRATVLEQNLHIQHLRERLAILTERQAPDEQAGLSSVSGLDKF